MCEDSKVGTVNCFSVGSNGVKFDDEINFLSIATLMDVMSLVSEGMDKNKPLTVYFSSTWGSLSDLQDLVDFVIGMLEEVEIVFVLNGLCMSGGAFIIYELINYCKVYIGDEAVVMFHTALFPGRSRSVLVNKTYEDTMNRYTDKYCEIFKNSGISKKDIKRFKKGEDVYYSGYMFREYLENYVGYMDSIRNAEYLNYLKNQVEMLENGVDIQEWVWYNIITSKV